MIRQRRRPRLELDSCTLFDDFHEASQLEVYQIMSAKLLPRGLPNKLCGSVPPNAWHKYNFTSSANLFLRTKESATTPEMIRLNPMKMLCSQSPRAGEGSADAYFQACQTWVTYATANNRDQSLRIEASTAPHRTPRN